MNIVIVKRNEMIINSGFVFLMSLPLYVIIILKNSNNTIFPDYFIIVVNSYAASPTTIYIKDLL